MNHLARIASLVSLVLVTSAAMSQDPGKQFLESRLKSAPDPVVYYDQVQEGIRLYSAGSSADAIPKLQSALAAYAEDGLVWLYLGFALNSTGRPKEAITAYENALKLKSAGQPHNIYQWLARAYMGAGDKEGAYKALEKAVFDEPYVRRPDLYDDPAFASLKAEPRFLKLVGRIDTSKMSRTEGWRTDIDYLVAEIKRVNHKYRNQPFPEDFMKRYRDLKRDVPKLTDDQVFTGMGAMLSTLHQGHLNVAILPETRLTPLRTLPVQFYAFPEGIYIVGSDDKNKDLVGAEVVKIEDTSPAEVLRQIEEHTSVENPIKIMWSGMQPLGTLQVLRGLGVLKPGHDSVRLSLRAKDGQTFERLLASVPTAQNRKLVPPPNVTAPLFVKDVRRAHWLEALPENDAVFLQLNQVAPDTDETMAQFGLKVRKFLTDTPVKNVILDVRHNNGGNTMTYPELLRTLIAHTTKEGNRLYVIIGRGVYSATGNLITDLERLANPIFVGEPSGGFGNQDGDESNVTLPYSGIRGWLTSVWWQYSHPWDERRSITPNVPVQLTAKAYFEGRDPAMETIAAMIKRGTP
jgi:tetratricopeptide (TPR) repeat protein